MFCPLCPSVAALGGFLGTYVGIRQPESKEGKIFCATISTVLTAVAVIVLKVFRGFSLCGNQAITTSSLVILLSKTIIIGIIFSVVVNILYNRFSVNNVNKECCCT
jgi:hypothetical protein